MSFKDALTEKELLRVLLTGKVPAERRPHIRLLLEEAPRSLVEGLIRLLLTLELRILRASGGRRTVEDLGDFISARSRTDG